MSGILDSRIFYHWRMAKRGSGYMTGSLVAAAAAGAFAGAAHHSQRMASLGITPAMGLTGFVVLVIATALLWWRFTSLQDEMFRRIQAYSYGWGGGVTVAILVVWGVANAAGLAPPIDPLAPLFLFALVKTFFWTKAVRTWL